MPDVAELSQERDRAGAAYIRALRHPTHDLAGFRQLHAALGQLVEAWTAWEAVRDAE